MSILRNIFPFFIFDFTDKPLIFDIFRLTFFYTLLVATIAFFIIVVLTREKVPEDKLKLTFDDYLKVWAETKEWDKPPEEVKGPLGPYLKIMLFFSKNYAKIGFTPNKVSIFSFLCACWALMLWLMNGPWIFLTWVLVVFSGTLDSIDGCLAYVTGKGSKRGAFYDHVLDKYGDCLWYAGILFFIVDTTPIYWGHMGLANMDLTQFIVGGLISLGVFIMLNTIIQEYCRARQQGLGLTETVVTFGERVTRILLYIFIASIVGLTFIFHTFWYGVFDTPFWWGIHFAIVQYIPIVTTFLFLGFTLLSTVQLVWHGKKRLPGPE